MKNIDKQLNELDKLLEIILQIKKELESKENISLYNLKYNINKIKLIDISLNEILSMKIKDNYKNGSLNILLFKNIFLLIIGIIFLKLNIPLLAILFAIIQITIILKNYNESNYIRKEFDKKTAKRIYVIQSIKRECNLIKELVLEKVNQTEKTKKEDKDIIGLANTVIWDLISGNMNYPISLNDWNIVKKVLQDDLNTEEQDIKKLIKQAKEKISIENISKELGIKRKILENQL